MTRPSIGAVVEQFLRASPPSDARRPQFTIILGGPATGKSRLRRAQFQHAGVHIDAGDLFVSLAPTEVLPFPDALGSSLEEAGNALARRALSERRSIVTEVIGEDQAVLLDLLETFNALGYEGHLELVTADREQAHRYNMSRGENNISAYYAQEFNIRWLRNAALELALPEAIRLDGGKGD